MSDQKLKQPSERLDFDFVADKRLTDDDYIVNAVSNVTGPDTLLLIDETTWTPNTAKVWVSGGTDNCIYKVTSIIYTKNGRRIEGEFNLRVKDI